MEMGRSYDVGQNTLLFAVGPLLSAGEGRFHHGKTIAEGIPRRVWGMWWRGAGVKGVQENARYLEAGFMLLAPFTILTQTYSSPERAKRYRGGHYHEIHQRVFE